MPTCRIGLQNRIKRFKDSQLNMKKSKKQLKIYKKVNFLGLIERPRVF